MFGVMRHVKKRYWKKERQRSSSIFRCFSYRIFMQWGFENYHGTFALTFCGDYYCITNIFLCISYFISTEYSLTIPVRNYSCTYCVTISFYSVFVIYWQMVLLKRHKSKIKLQKYLPQVKRKKTTQILCLRRRDCLMRLRCAIGAVG